MKRKQQHQGLLFLIKEKEESKNGISIERCVYRKKSGSYVE